MYPYFTGSDNILLTYKYRSDRHVINTETKITYLPITIKKLTLLFRLQYYQFSFSTIIKVALHYS